MVSKKGGLVLAALVLGLSACTSAPAPPLPPPVTTAKPVTLTFGVYGPDEQVAAIQRMVDAFNTSSATRKVDLVTWADHDEAVADVLDGEAPDVFMAARSDVGELVDAEAVRPVSLLLDERGVDFGDRFSRDAVDAFAIDDDLQCMAYTVSPMVMYYNDELIDFEQMEAEELDVPNQVAERWSIAEFTEAAQFASRRGNVRGVWIEPTLKGLAPFIYSGGGQVFDDDEDPTSLAFSDDATRDALNQILPVLRDPTLTPTERQLKRFTPKQLFKRGKLAMIAGYRDLVPELRRKDDLSFDVISMPVLDTPATVGDLDGLCISADTDNVQHAADFLAYAVSDSSVETVTSTGYIVPANTQVAGSAIFLSPFQQPAHARLFNLAIRGMVVPPFVTQRDELVDAVAPLLERMVTAPGVLDLERTTERIDAVSKTVLDSDPEESEGDDTSVD